jgi:TatD DNase family protein
MRLIDSHVHLQAPAFSDDDELVVAAARSSGVERLLVPGWDAQSSSAALALAASDGGIDAGAGIHPHAASAADEAAWQTVVALVDDRRVLAVGETGLDYDRALSPPDVQLTNLRRHLALSLRCGKPAILHCRSKPGRREAHDDLLRELEDAGRPPAVLHSFSGPVDYAERALEMGLAISFSGLVFRAGEEASAEVARMVPPDRLLIETDSPYLAPPGAPRRRNEPRYVASTAEWLAGQRGVDPVELGELLVANYDRLFSRPPS